MTFIRNGVITLPNWLVTFVLPALISGIISYGVFTAKQATIDEKIAQIEKVQAATATKAENVLMIQNLQIQLDNINANLTKIDIKIEQHMNKDID